MFPSQHPTLLAPGQRLVLVNDLFHFQQRHGIDIPVGGIFTGALSNGGERITFADAASNGHMIGASHISFPGIGRLRSAGRQGYTWIPLNYSGLK